nr:acyl-CoA dehydrogenase family protein [Pseudonocardia sp. C8]
MAAAIHFAPVAAAAYLGVARGALAETGRLLAARTDPPASAVRRLGEVTARVRGARWALHGAVAEVGEYPPLDEATLATVMTAKRQAVLEARAAVDGAMEIVGGPAFHRGSALERAYRDVRGGPFHPLPPESTLELLGTRALRAAART